MAKDSYNKAPLENLLKAIVVLRKVLGVRTYLGGFYDSRSGHADLVLGIDEPIVLGFTPTHVYLSFKGAHIKKFLFSEDNIIHAFGMVTLRDSTEQNVSDMDSTSYIKLMENSKGWIYRGQTQKGGHKYLKFTNFDHDFDLHFVDKYFWAFENPWLLSNNQGFFI